MSRGTASPLEHGGALDRAIARHGGRRQDWLDLSTGINPVAWPVPPVSAHAWQNLPDSGAVLRLLDAARRYYGVGSVAAIVAAPGTQALIETLPGMLQARTVAIVSPTYGEHAHAWHKQGCKVAETDDLETATDVLVVVNPNNPDGRVHAREALIDAASRLEVRNGWLVVDEAFADPSPAESLASEVPRNVVILKSFGKFFGLAGLRLGFAICAREMAERIAARLGPWAVSGPALEIGAAAFADTEWIEATRLRLAQQSTDLAQMLAGFGFEILTSQALFVLARHDEAQRLAEGLAKQHILVRPFAYRRDWLRFGLPADETELARLEWGLREVLAEARS